MIIKRSESMEEKIVEFARSWKELQVSFNRLRDRAIQVTNDFDKQIKKIRAILKNANIIR